MKKILLLSIVFLLSISMVTISLLAIGEEKALAQEQVEISLWIEIGYWEGYFYEATDMYSAEHPNVKFNIIPMENVAIWTNLLMAFQSGAEDLDASYAWGGSMTGEIGELGLAVDLRPYQAKYGWLEKQVPMMSSPGMLDYCQLLNVVGRRHIYRKDIYEELGLTLPRTWDEFYQQGKKIREAGYGVISLGNVAQWPGNEFFAVLLGVHATPEQAHELGMWKKDVETAGIWKGAPVVNTLAHMKELVEKEIFMGGVNAIEYGEGRNLFMQKKAAVWQAGSWELDIIPKEMEDFEKYVGTFPLIPIDGRAYVQQDFGTGIAIPTYTKEKAPEKFEVIIDFIDTLLTKPYQKTLYKHSIISASNELTEQDLVEAAPNQMFIEWAEAIGGPGDHVMFQGQWAGRSFSEEFFAVTQGVLGLQLEPEEAAERLYRKAIEVAEWE